MNPYVPEFVRDADKAIDHPVSESTKRIAKAGTELYYILNVVQLVLQDHGSTNEVRKILSHIFGTHEHLHDKHLQMLKDYIHGLLDARNFHWRIEDFMESHWIVKEEGETEQLKPRSEKETHSNPGLLIRQSADNGSWARSEACPILGWTHYNSNIIYLWTGYPNGRNDLVDAQQISEVVPGRVDRGQSLEEVVGVEKTLFSLILHEMTHTCLFSTDEAYGVQNIYDIPRSRDPERSYLNADSITIAISLIFMQAQHPHFSFCDPNCILRVQFSRPAVIGRAIEKIKEIHKSKNKNWGFIGHEANVQLVNYKYQRKQGIELQLTPFKSGSYLKNTRS